jgi:hypothetical protein
VLPHPVQSWLDERAKTIDILNAVVPYWPSELDSWA